MYNSFTINLIVKGDIKNRTPLFARISLIPTALLGYRETRKARVFYLLSKVNEAL